MFYLRQGTTTSIKLGPFVDDTDGKTAETGLAGTMTVELSKCMYSGGNLTFTTFSSRSDATAIAHDAAGYYTVVLDTNDTAVAGPLKVKATASGALPVWADFVVLDADTYDAMVLGSVPFPIGLSSTAISNLGDDYDGTGYAKTNSSIGTVGTVTNEVSANVTKISGDSLAADNAELFFDGTGYSAFASTIGTVTSVTNEVNANVTKVSGDSVAADNLEAMFDGTGYDAANSAIGSVDDVTNPVEADMTAIGGNATAATKLAAIALAATMGSVAAGTLTSSSFPTDLSEATNDHFIGGAIKFYTGALAGQLGYISDYDGATKTVTVSPALTEAPSVGDDFIIV